MENILELINQFFVNDKTIRLKKNNHSYQYVGISTTILQGVKFESISYKISDGNLKRVTKELLIDVLAYYDANNNFPDNYWYKTKFDFELKSRPCNKLVAEIFITKLRNIN